MKNGFMHIIIGSIIAVLTYYFILPPQWYKLLHDHTIGSNFNGRRRTFKDDRLHKWIKDESKHDQAFKLIKSGDIDIEVLDARGHTPLFIASTMGYDKLVEVLLKEGANPNLKDQQGYTPLMVATLNSNPQGGYAGKLVYVCVWICMRSYYSYYQL